ncbi:MAG: ABC transporter ATP-binding protein [Vicinamibacterales bacterium]
MSDVAIRTEGLRKRYQLGARASAFRYGALRDTLSDLLAAPFRRAAGREQSANGRAPHIWALDGVTLEVRKGEVLGVIGRNGSGKSTLLKILSRITRPTEGWADLYGRVGSLLEVGTGFHPELTGRENIFLNGAILGMRRAEILRKFDDIVDFSGVSKFIDTPVRHYSSGMYVRLAFAVAAHLEPEVLLVDEVLAVGDAAFQRQCLGKMQDVSQSGRTILFVSHNMPAVTRLCSRAVLLTDGRISEDGPADTVVSRYLSAELGTAAVREWADQASAPGNEAVRLKSVRVIDADGRPVDSIDVRRAVGVEIVFDVTAQKYQFVPGFTLANDEGQPIFNAIDTAPAWREARPPGQYTTIGWIPGNLLNEGRVVVSVALGTFVAGGRSIRQAHALDVVSFQVVDPGEGGTARGDYPGHWPAPVRPLLQWTTVRR